LILLKEALKAQVAAYKKAIEDAIKAAAAVAVEDTLTELSDPIELDLDNRNNSDDNTYTTFKDINDIKAIKVEDNRDSVLD
jgi:hypothetical protein